MLRNSNSIYFRFNFTVLIKILITEPPFCPFLSQNEKNWGHNWDSLYLYNPNIGVLKANQIRLRLSFVFWSGTNYLHSLETSLSKYLKARLSSALVPNEV